MKRFTTILTGVLVLGLGAAPASAVLGFFDNFDTYSTEVVLPSPWEEANDTSDEEEFLHPTTSSANGSGTPFSGLNAVHGIGPIADPIFRATGHPASSPFTLTARMLSTDSGDGRVHVGLSAATSGNKSDDFRPSNSQDVMYIAFRKRLGVAWMDYNSTQIDGGFIGDGGGITAPFAFQFDTWVDVRMTGTPLGDTRWDIEFAVKEPASSEWFIVDTLTSHRNFAPTYVFLEATENGLIDDVSFVPEPGTLALLGLGGLLFGRRGRHHA